MSPFLALSDILPPASSPLTEISPPFEVRETLLATESGAREMLSFVVEILIEVKSVSGTAKEILRNSADGFTPK